MPLPSKITDSIYFHHITTDQNPLLLAKIDTEIPNNSAYIRYAGTLTEREKTVTLVLKKKNQTYPGKVHVNSKEVDGKVELEIHGGSDKHFKSLEDFVAYVKEERKFNFLINCIPLDNPPQGVIAISKKDMEEAEKKINFILKYDIEAQQTIFGFAIPNLDKTTSFTIKKIVNSSYLVIPKNDASTDSLIISKQQLKQIIAYQQKMILHYSPSNSELNSQPNTTPELYTQAQSSTNLRTH